jgi:hypothetical protein
MRFGQKLKIKGKKMRGIERYRREESEIKRIGLGHEHFIGMGV